MRLQLLQTGLKRGLDSIRLLRVLGAGGCPKLCISQFHLLASKLDALPRRLARPSYCRLWQWYDGHYCSHVPHDVRLSVCQQRPGLILMIRAPLAPDAARPPTHPSNRRGSPCGSRTNFHRNEANYQMFYQMFDQMFLIIFPGSLSDVQTELKL